MASFTTRILIKGNPPYSDYSALHAAMEDREFTRTIESDDGIIYALPNAEYNLIGPYTKEKVLDLAKEAVRTLPGKTAEILVTESKGRKWSGLEKLYN